MFLFIFIIRFASFSEKGDRVWKHARRIYIKSRALGSLLPSLPPLLPSSPPSNSSVRDASTSCGGGSGRRRGEGKEGKEGREEGREGEGGEVRVEREEGGRGGEREGGEKSGVTV